MSGINEPTEIAQELGEKLKVPNVEFDAWVASMPAKHWSKYDLSACRLGWEAGRRLLMSEPAERQIWSLEMSETPTLPAIPEVAIEAALDAQRTVIANDHDRMQVALFAALPHLDAPAPIPGDLTEAHPDDLAVDRFAAAMKVKLAEKRSEGRGSWENKDECSAEFLSQLLREHVAKGDPVDVANLAMMLHQRGETIISSATQEDAEAAASISAPTPQ